MAVTKSQKVSLLATLRDHIGTQTSIVFLTTHGANEPLNASRNVELRQKARKEQVSLKVVKNTLIQLAFGQHKGFPESLEGPTYVVYHTEGKGDEVAVPKAIVNLVKQDFKDNFSILGSIVDGVFYDGKRTEELANTPSLSESMAKLAGALQQLAGGKIATLVKEVHSQVARAVGEVARTKTV